MIPELLYALKPVPMVAGSLLTRPAEKRIEISNEKCCPDIHPNSANTRNTNEIIPFEIRKKIEIIVVLENVSKTVGKKKDPIYWLRKKIFSTLL